MPPMRRGCGTAEANKGDFLVSVCTVIDTDQINHPRTVNHTRGMAPSFCPSTWNRILLYALRDARAPASLEGNPSIMSLIGSRHATDSNPEERGRLTREYSTACENNVPIRASPPVSSSPQAPLPSHKSSGPRAAMLTLQCRRSIASLIESR
ncbi:hypothetical protein R3P38DRAFT_3206015 [Favolaschia claudopus]|uniref:Uncharacterized protein n=1 Tax=Favolaschia claudopus TaxID=2862362 RepID=A0AAW0AM27_9AGAR